MRNVESDAAIGQTHCFTRGSAQTPNTAAQTYEKNLEGSRLTSGFVADMSLEIRTPLNGILGMSHPLTKSALFFNHQG